MKDIERIARNFTAYMKRTALREELGDVVRFFRARVVKAAAGGKITVRRAFDETDLALPCAAGAEALAVGDPCLVLVFGTLSNAVVFAMNNG